MHLPERHCISLPDGNIVHHFIIGLGIPLAVDGQTCREKEEQSERHHSQRLPRRGEVSTDTHLVLQSFRGRQHGNSVIQFISETFESETELPISPLMRLNPVTDIKN